MTRRSRLRPLPVRAPSSMLANPMLARPMLAKPKLAKPKLAKPMLADRIVAGLLLAGLLLTSGCERGTPVPQAPAPAATPGADAAELAEDPAVVEATRGTVAGVAVGEGRAPVDVRFALPQAPRPGEPFVVQVAVLPRATVPAMRVEVRPDAALEVLEPTAPLGFEKVQAATVHRFDVRARAPRAGTAVLSVLVTLESPVDDESRAFAYPLVIGAAAPVDAAAR